MPKSSPEKAKHIKRTVKNLYRSLKPYYLPIILAFVFAIISVLLSILGPKILGNITTSAVESYTATGTVDWLPIRQLAHLLITIYLASSIFAYLESIIMAIVTAKYAQSLRAAILDKINRLPVSYFDRHAFGDTLSRMSNDIDTIASGLSEELVEIISNTITIVGILVIMLTISIHLSVVALVTVPLASIFVLKITKKAQKLFVSSRETLGKLSNRIEEDYSGQVIIKSNSHEQASLDAFRAVNDRYRSESFRATFLSRLSFPVVHIITSLGYTAVCILGGLLAIGGKITIGNIQAFIQYTNQFNRPISDISETLANLQLTLAACERVFDFLAEPEETPDFPPAKTLDRVRGAVSFHDVSFSYDKDTPIIRNFSVDVQPGSQVAVVGPTGAGKTTIINLLMRFYEPDSGYITIDGIPISEMKRSDVRGLFGMVLQDTWLFSGTVAENLKYGNKNATIEDIKRSTKLANIDHFIESLDKGYDALISEDSDNISAGEKQLLTIARALVANPPMIILDEATSNVDTRTEQLIQSAFEKLTKGRTSFVIAHRLSTIRNADLILVMQNGKIVERGNHDELLKQNGFYAELYNSQFADS
ncbi:ABC transporter ATP-binding protein [Candidatus Saccharibacteria bacterium]|nr:ABC transporter ATP-binding protein [Candidatus Saccharibacteria bacterium]